MAFSWRHATAQEKARWLRMQIDDHSAKLAIWRRTGWCEDRRVDARWLNREQACIDEMRALLRENEHLAALESVRTK